MIDRLWGLTAGLLIGAGVGGHALRLVILGGGPIAARHGVAGFAVALYAAAAWLTWQQRRSGLWIAVIGPMIGVTAVTLAPNARIDTFQVVLGVWQMLALAVSILLLIATRGDAERER